VNSKTYFILLGVVLVINAALSFYHSRVAKENYQALEGVIKFQKQGARYTYDDGVHDRADRDRVDAELDTRIKALEAK
jgi:hypothetical protein